MNKSVPDVSVIVVNYNTRDLLRTCLRQVIAGQTGRFSQEITVIDNGSADGSGAMIRNCFPKVQLIENADNRGFAAANNQGIRISRGRYILLLNSDTEVSFGAIETVVGHMEADQTVGAGTCKLLLPDGSMDPACHRGFPTPWASVSYFSGLERLFPHSKIFGGYHQGYKDSYRAHTIDSPSGAFFLVRRDVVDRIGLLDEAYFMYGEDLDWAYRINAGGWKIMYYPDVTTLHRKKQSGRDHADPELRQKTRRYFYETMRLFYRKHYAGKYGPLVTGVVLSGIRIQSVI
ncbi:glycosyltransferase family 2 protein [Patescibacteria group bacterium]|nr:glycosyltransferase family 2 protein [Patescibacteria group bacterium]